MEDRQRSLPALLAGFAYGILIGYLISTASFSTIFLAALLAQPLAGKIDRPGHLVGFAIALLLPFFGLGWQSFDPLAFALFFLSAYFDELSWGGRWKQLLEYRPFLKLAALAYAFPAGRWDYIFSILAFDGGYTLARGFKI